MVAQLYPEKENSTFEFKEKISDTFLKTVSAYANYCDGKIIFGISKDGSIVGVLDAEQFRLQVENKINDSIIPRPTFIIKTVIIEEKALVELQVMKGKETPYYYNGKAYKRSDTSSTPLDAGEHRRLAIDGSGISFDQLVSTEDDLSFTVLERELQKAVGLTKLSDDSLRTLGLMNKNRYLRAGELLADTNHNAQSATIAIRFGKTNSEFMDRVDLTYQSIISQYQGAIDIFDKWYQPYEVVEGFKRISRIQVPRDAYREAVANALIHRRYDQNGAVQIAMYEDRIEITSPGSLPDGVSETAYLYSQISIPRNLIIAEVFYRLHIIEKFGTGIDRIREKYKNYASKPEFEVSSVFIRVVLPVIEYTKELKEISLEEQILLLIGESAGMSRSELEIATGYQRTSLTEVLGQLVDSEKLERTRTGRSVFYKIKY